MRLFDCRSLRVVVFSLSASFLSFSGDCVAESKTVLCYVNGAPAQIAAEGRAATEETLASRVISKGVPSLTLPQVRHATFAPVPPDKEPLVRARLKDSVATVDKAINFNEVMKFLGVTLSSAQEGFLNQHKFLLIEKNATRFKGQVALGQGLAPGVWDEMLGLYGVIGGSGRASDRLPENARLVTPDVVLHAFHKWFEESLKHLEENELADLLKNFVRGVRNKALKYREGSDDTLAAHYELIAAQFTAPLILIENARWESEEEAERRWQSTHTGDEDDEKLEQQDDSDTLHNALKLLAEDGLASELSVGMRKRVELELSLIYEAGKTTPSPLFGHYSGDPAVVADYTQFTPRSHYATRSTLRAYFRTMMYFARNSYLLGKDEGITDAILVAHLMASPGAGGKSVLADWQQLMEITGFYAGQSDDITYPEWRDFLVRILGKEILAPAEATAAVTVGKISSLLNELRPPRILSDLVLSEHIADMSKDRLLQATKGFRVFGQRFTLDAWILSQLTAGEEKTEVRLPSTPSALFVPAVLGDTLARRLSGQFLEEAVPRFSNDDVEKFFGALDHLASDIRRVQDPEWFTSISSAWLMVLRPIQGAFGEGYPLYMQSKLFPLKQLQTFLGSYSELKHDTLLYAKQMYAEFGNGEEPEPPPVPKGFVEPNLRFWVALQRLVEYIDEGLKRHGLLPLDREYYGRLARFKRKVDFFTMLAIKELRGEEITEPEYEELRLSDLEYMAEPHRKGAIYTEEDMRSALVADIATDAVKGRVLYEATGEPHIMLALVGNEDTPRLTIGVAFNHYEFTKPLGKRLTDADWQETVYKLPDDLPPKNFWYNDLIVK